jgi:uncharacterized protein (TIGR03067 family)
MPRRLAAVCLLLSPLAAHAFGAADERTQREEEKLAGAWRVVGLEQGGRAAPPNVYRGLKMTFRKGGTFTSEFGRDRQEGQYKLIPSAAPRQMDIVRGAGRKQLAIYSLAGSTLKICTFGSDKERPDGFDTRGQPDCTLMTLRREP